MSAWNKAVRNGRGCFWARGQCAADLWILGRTAPKPEHEMEVKLGRNRLGELALLVVVAGAVVATVVSGDQGTKLEG